MAATTTADYPYGPNNIIYKAQAFATGKIVTCFVWTPALKKSELITLTELEDFGLYHFRFTFDTYGIYSGLFFEDDMKTKFHTFRVVVGSII